jgi:hypothetical protein
MLTKYIKSVLCGVAVRLFYIWDARCLKVKGASSACTQWHGALSSTTTEFGAYSLFLFNHFFYSYIPTTI